MATATLVGGFTYVEVTLTDIEPAQGPITGGTTVTLTGTGLDSPNNVVTFAGVEATDVTVISDTEITCVTPAGFDVVDVVLTQDNASATLESAFQYTLTLPSITSISPNTGSQTGGTEITVIGANFDSYSEIYIDINPCTGLTLVSDTEITCVVPAGTLGAKDVTVNNQFGSFTVTNGFTYYTSALTLIGTSPVASLTTGGGDISISGLNFDGSTTVEIGGVPIVDGVYYSSTLITGKIPAGVAGSASVLATKGTETYQLTDYFTYVTPLVLTSISPNTGLPSGGESVTVTGSGINSEAIVTIGGIPLVDLVVVNDTTITGKIPPNSTGAKDVVLSQNTAVGVLSSILVNGFTYGTEGNLGNDPIKTSYDQLLYVAGGVTDESKPIQDASGNYTPVNISTVSVDINSDTVIIGKLVV